MERWFTEVRREESQNLCPLGGAELRFFRIKRDKGETLNSLFDLVRIS
jgi:hypothetical protein